MGASVSIAKRSIKFAGEHAYSQASVFEESPSGPYIGDGDLSSFKNLLQSDHYDGEVPIRKEECIGHVQKRLKKRLKKKFKGLTSLPQSKTERITHLYALVIVQYHGQSASEIHNGLQVLLKHTKEAHDNCPAGDGSWCYYLKKVALFQSDSRNSPPTTREPYLFQPSFRAALRCSRSSDH